MKFVLPYQDADKDVQTTDHKKKVSNFINQLQQLGFPKKNIQRDQSSVTIDVENTVLSLKFRPSNSFYVLKSLWYGNQILVELQVKFDVQVQSCFITFHEENYTKLPQNLRLDRNEIANEKAVVDNIVLQEKNTLPKGPSRIFEPKENDLTAQDKLEQRLIPIITQEWIKQGYQGDVLESKVSRTLNSACVKLKELENEDRPEPAKTPRFAKLKQLFFCCCQSRNQIHPLELNKQEANTLK